MLSWDSSMLTRTELAWSWTCFVEKCRDMRKVKGPELWKGLLMKTLSIVVAPESFQEANWDGSSNAEQKERLQSGWALVSNSSCVAALLEFVGLRFGIFEGGCCLFIENPGKGFWLNNVQYGLGVCLSHFSSWSCLGDPPKVGYVLKQVKLLLNAFTMIFLEYSKVGFKNVPVGLLKDEWDDELRWWIEMN